MGTVKGKIEVNVNQEKTSASLVFTPQSPGKVWDLKNVLDLLEKEKITYGVNREDIQKALKQFGDSKKNTRSGPVARGVDPEAASLGDFHLIKKEIEPSLKSIMAQAVRKAGPPEFSEKINQEIREASYFSKEEIIGSFSEGKEGQEGTSVFGEKIPIPTELEKDSFLIGKGIVKTTRNELKTQKNGFVRLGENWADLVPFENHRWKISANEEDTALYLEFSPGVGSPQVPKAEQILEEAEKLSARGNYIDSAVINQFIADTIRSGKTAKLPLEKGEDSYIAIETDPLNIKAELVLIKGKSKGKPLSLKAVSKLINESGLKKLDSEKTKKEIMDFYRSKEGEVRLLLCEGTPPGRGKERSLNFSIPFLDQSYLELLIDKVELDDTLISRYSSIKKFPIEKIQKIAMVEKDQVIFTLSPDAKGKDGVDVFGKPVPGLKGNDPRLNLYENIEFQKGTAKAAIPGILEIGEDEDNNTYYARIREHSNAPITINISDNKMSALLSVGLASGTGFAADNTMISEALKKAGVVAGLMEESIDKAAETSGLGEVITDLVVAEGKFPLDGNRELKLLHDIDYRDKNKNYAPMKAGDKIGYLNVSTEDSEGYTVTGEPLVIEQDEDEIEIGANISQNETDELDQVELIAEKSGRLIFTGSKLFIQDTILIEGDLSPHMGKVDFPGNVMINGTVLSKAMVRAGENITIAGVVQAALVSAGGLIRVDKGIKGSQKAVLRGQIIEFDYAEEANIMAVEKIKCHKAMMRCKVQCNGFLDLNEKGTRLVGGEVKARNGMDVETIGNERGIETIIHFGQDFLIEDQISQLNRDLEKINIQINRIDEIIEKARGRADKQDVLMKARDKKVRILKGMDKKNVKIFLLREKFEEHFESSVKVRGDLFEGTQFYSHGRSLTINTRKRSVEIYFSRDNGKISERPLK
jgi:uncharacterized protein (DUF342 family)